MKTFFLSIKTTVWTLTALVCLFFIGSYMMPAHRDTFTLMNDALLLDWVGTVAVQNPHRTWWFFASLAALVLLTINTIVCSLQAVRGRWTRKDFLLRISPQIVHAGFLFILLAHLISAGWGYRLSGAMPEGAYTGLPENRALYLREVRMTASEAGYPSDWAAEVYLFENSERVRTGTLGPNRPLFYKGVGIYLKSLDFESGQSAFLMVNKDPGAVWALAGAILFLTGSVPILAIKLMKA